MDRQELRATLLDIVEQETWERPADLSDEILLQEGLKLDSVDMLTIMMRIESKLGIKLINSDFEGVESVGNLLDVLQKKFPPTSQSKAA